MFEWRWLKTKYVKERTKLKRILHAKLLYICLVFKLLNLLSERLNVFKLKMSKPLFWRELVCMFLSPSHSHVHTDQYVARDWYATPAWGKWIDLIYCGVPLRYFCVHFLFHNAAGVEQATGESKRGKEERQRMCNISVRLTVDVEVTWECVEVHWSWSLT